MGTLAVQLAEAVAAQYQARLPARILAKGRDLLLNAAAVAIAGHDHPGWKSLSSGWPPPPAPAAGRRGGPGRLRDPGAGQVALLFTAAASVHDFDDGHIDTLIHPSCVNMGAALGSASLAEVTGRDFLTAFLLGCELEIRFARALTPEALDRGWDLDGVCGPLSAAITSALLLGAGPEMLGNAVSIAASSTLGHLSSAGSMLRPFVTGKASANGVASALLSRRGFTASPGALDSPRGLGSALVQRPAVFRTVTAGLGTEWLLDEVLIKRYPCAILLHPVVDAALALRAAAPDDTGRMSTTVRCSPLTARLTSCAHPADGLQAKISAQHCVATALREGRVLMEHFTDEYTRAMTAAAAQIRVDADAHLPPPAAEVMAGPAAGTASGRARPAVFRSGKHTPAPDEVAMKARSVLRDQRQDGVAESLITFLSAIDEQPDVRSLMTATCG